MEIIKPGKIRKIKLKCDECGCEFTCNLGELTHIMGNTGMLIAYKAHDGKLYE